MWNSPTLNFDGWASAWNAPSSASSETRRPVIVPSALSAISPCMWKSRANPVEIRFSLRSSIHFTGMAEQQRGRRRHDVARVHRHLVAEPAAEVGRDDPDLLLRQAGDEREHRSDRVRRLRGHVDRGLAGGRVHVGDAPARLQRRRVRARVERVERDHLVGLRERLRRWPPGRRPPSGRCGCRSGPPSRRGSAARRPPPPAAARRRPRAARSRRRSARARPWRCRGRSRSRRRPPGPGTAPCR